MDYVWLFEPSLAVHPSSNPLAQLVHVMRSTEAYLVYPRPLSPPNAPVANAPSQGHPEDTGCAVSTVRNAPLSLSTVIKADAWKLLHGSVLARYDEAQLEKLEPGFEMLFCGLISQRWGDTGRPACIEAQTLFSTRLAERREQVEASPSSAGRATRKAARRRCDGRTQMPSTQACTMTAAAGRQDREG